AAQAIVNRLVDRDNRQINQNLQNQVILTSLQELIRQMKISGDTVLNMSISATPSFPVNGGWGNPEFPNNLGNGNGILVTSVKRPFDGLVLENSFAENLLFTCTGDTYTGGSSAGNESFVATG